MWPILWSYVFIGSIYMLNIVNGTAITTAECGDPVAEGDPQVLTCHITGSVAVGINWFREGNTNSIITCTSKICIANNKTLYSVNSTPHPDNKQQFTIKSLSGEDFTKTWICIDGDYYPDPTATGSSCMLSETPSNASTHPTDPTPPTSSTPVTENTAQTAWTVIGCIVWFMAGLCCGILGVLIYLKRLHCLQAKNTSDTEAVTYDAVGAGIVNAYYGINMTVFTDNQTSPVYINQTTDTDHPPAFSRESISHTARSGGSNPDNPQVPNIDVINQIVGDRGSNPVNTYEHLTRAYTNEHNYETL